MRFGSYSVSSTVIYGIIIYGNSHGFLTYFFFLQDTKKYIITRRAD